MLAFGSMSENKEVTWFPSYGAEMRGGTANCTVIISDAMIGSPVVLSPDILVAMNKASLDKFLPRVRKKGLVFFDSSLSRLNGIKSDILSIGIPATKIASSLDGTKSANMVMLGALIAETGILKKSSITALFDKHSKSSGKEGPKINAASFLEGISYIENKKS